MYIVLANIVSHKTCKEFIFGFNPPTKEGKQIKSSLHEERRSHGRRIQNTCL